MSKLQELKEICGEKEALANKLNTDFCKRIIIRDLEQLRLKNPELISQGNEKYILGKLVITISKEGLLNIEDKRGSAFLWGFEVEHKKAIRIGDAFKYDKQIESVSIMKDTDDPELLNEVQNVIAEFEQAIDFLKSNIPLETWEYKYYDCHEEVMCNNLDEVIATVLNRKFY